MRYDSKLGGSDAGKYVPRNLEGACCVCEGVHVLHEVRIVRGSVLACDGCRSKLVALMRIPHIVELRSTHQLVFSGNVFECEDYLAMFHQADVNRMQILKVGV